MTSAADTDAATAAVEDELIARAIALRPLLIERMAETAALRRPAQDVQDEFVRAGFYRMLVPRRYGGLEVGVPTFLRVVRELARGCPSATWCMCLGASHALQLASWWPEETQSEIFGDGHFVSPMVASPVGVARPVDGGWRLTGQTKYASGAPYATHFIGQMFGPPPAPGVPGDLMLFVAPRSSWTMVDDWGTTLGLKGSGSNSVRFDDAFLPDRHVLPNTSMEEAGGTVASPGYDLHGPLYAGRGLSYFHMELAALQLGAAFGALDEYERLTRERTTMLPPIVPRSEDADYQRWYGKAAGTLFFVEMAFNGMMAQWVDEVGRIAPGVEHTREEDFRLALVSRDIVTTAWKTVEGVIAMTAGTSLMSEGQRLERIYRDMVMNRGHFGSVQIDWLRRELGREHFDASQRQIVADAPGVR
jgi:3-hydroxy-9,10-secoandrosta-1,3,5(10)-triene-9,17-dione monooxygenase